jgi:hypothetical protein
MMLAWAWYGRVAHTTAHTIVASFGEHHTQDCLIVTGQFTFLTEKCQVMMNVVSARYL